MFAYALVVVLAFIAATSTVSAAVSGVPGFLTISATYATTDTSCTGSPVLLMYYQLNVCVSYSPAYTVFTADAAGNLLSTPYSDSACTVASGSATSLNAGIIKCLGGFSKYIYTAQAPDTIVSTQPSGSILANYITYNSGDTTCAKTPYSLTYFTVQTCYPNPLISTQSQQYLVDGSGTVFTRYFAGTTTCASGMGMVTVQYTGVPKLCTPSTSTSSGPSSSYQFLGASLPSTWVPTQYQT